MTTQPTISEGATGHVVRWAQYLLVRRELSYSDIDGIFGPYTRAAVESFQAGAGLVVDGVVGPITWGALGGDAPQPPTLRRGSNGEIVATLQTVLNEGRGDFSSDSDPALVVDGVFGPKTAAAVEGTQELAGAVVDGVVGFQTWALPVHAAGQVIADLCGVTGPGSS